MNKRKILIIGSIVFLSLSLISIICLFIFKNKIFKKEELKKDETPQEVVIPQDTQKPTTETKSEYISKVRLLTKVTKYNGTENTEKYALVNIEDNTQKVIEEYTYNYDNKYIDTEFIYLKGDLYKLQSVVNVKTTTGSDGPEFRTHTPIDGKLSVSRYDALKQEYVTLYELKTSESIWSTHKVDENGIYFVAVNKKTGYESISCSVSDLYYFDTKTVKKVGEPMKGICPNILSMDNNAVFYDEEMMGGINVYGFLVKNSKGLFAKTVEVSTDVDVSSKYGEGASIYLSDLIASNTANKTAYLFGFYNIYNEAQDEVTKTYVLVYKLDGINKKFSETKILEFPGSPTMEVIEGKLRIDQEETSLFYDPYTGKSETVTRSVEGSVDDSLPVVDEKSYTFDSETFRLKVDRGSFEQSHKVIVNVVVSKDNSNIWEHDFVAPEGEDIRALDLVKL